MKFFKEWLVDVKFQLRISPNDYTSDSLLLTYIDVAYTSIWENYYRKDRPLDDSSIEWVSDNKTRLATIHLTVTLFSNPDENQEAINVKDDRMIFRILGKRIGY